MSKLTDFKLLCFDCYGTLIDWERGMLTALTPLLEKSGSPSIDPKHILEVLHPLEAAEEASHPDSKYSEVLAALHPQLCQKLGLEKPTAEESKKFGESVAEWPAFEDTVEALKRLKKVYKLVVLSNVDNTSFQKNRVNDKGLKGFEFDAIYTAEDVGSYKPDLKNFEYMLRRVGDEFGVKKEEVLQTAQSQFHDHHPAREMGIKSSWIYRPGAIMGNREDPCWNWKFDTLAEMADAVEKEVAERK